MTDESGHLGRGIWATDRNGDLQLVAHTGMYLEPTPNLGGTIASLRMHAGGSSDNGYLAALNDAGLIAFSVEFSHGAEAVIVASLQEGDFDVDGDVDITDLNIVRNNFAWTFDIFDLNKVRNHFGEGPPTTSVPEPGAWSLAVIATLAGIGMARRRYGDMRFPGRRVR